jgi:hypothetical protein
MEEKLRPADLSFTICKPPLVMFCIEIFVFPHVSKITGRI